MAVLINFNGRKNGKKAVYADSNSVENLCRYVVGESGKHSDDEILGIGAYGVDDHGTTQKMVDQMQIVQRAYGIEGRGGRRMAHMCLSVTEEEFGSLGCNEELLMDYFADCARDIYDMGYQEVFGVHLNQQSPDHENCAFAHMHMAVSSINYESGRKFHMTKKEFMDEEATMNQKMAEYQEFSPVTFKDVDIYRRTGERR